MAPRKRPFVVGIGGGTASGKSTFCTKIAEQFPKGHCAILPLDNYYRCHAHQEPEIRAQANYDHPEALEFSLLVAHLESLKNQESVAMPSYDFATHSRGRETTLVKPCPLIITEGILVLAHEQVRNHLDLSIYFEADEDLRFHKRLERDIRERGRTRESVQNQWKTSVAPMYREYCEPSKSFADYVVHNYEDTNWLLSILFERSTLRSTSE